MQFKNAPFWIELIESGIVIVSMPQSLKALSAIAFTLSGKVTVFRLVHPEKADVPIILILLLLAKDRELRFPQFTNIPFLISFNLEGNDIDVIPQYPKA